MHKIEEKIETKAAPKKVWRAWADHWKHAGHGPFREGLSGAVIQRGRKAPFRISNVTPNKSFQVNWHAFLMCMVFTYDVKPKDKRGSIVRCRVDFRGFLGGPIGLFLKSKLKKSVRESLTQFVSQLEMMPD